MRKISSILAVSAVLAFSTVANASEMEGIDLGVKVGTLGLGVEVNYPVSPRFTVSAGINKFSRSFTETTDGIDYEADLNLQTISLLANFHPFAGSFRLTGGFMVNSNQIKMTAEPVAGQTFDIGNTVYDSTLVGTLKATVDFNNFAPYVGIGVGHSASSGFGFNLDVGVLMQGAPKVSFEAVGTDPTILAALEADLVREEANAEDDIKGFTMYPVISAGVNYRF